MHPRTEEFLRHFHDQHELLRRAVESVPPEQRATKPAPDRWSVAEILEHIALVEDRLGKWFASKVAEARTSGSSIEPHVPELHPFDRAKVLDRSRRVTAGEAVRPTGKLDPAEAWAAVESSYESFRQVVRASDDVPLGRIVQPHPVFGPLSLYGWAEFVAGHEARHAAQISEIGQASAAVLADHGRGG